MMRDDSDTPTHYLDHASTTTLRPEARHAMDRAMEGANGNASGTHSFARAAKNLLEAAREQAAEILGVSRPHDIVFTSGGTESDNLAIVGAALASDRRQVVVSAVDHKAVLEPAHSLAKLGFAVSEVPPGSDGIVRESAVASLVDHTTAVVSVIAANNEVGTLQPIAEIARAVRQVDPAIVVHTDAVQAFVGTAVTAPATTADLISLSAHKFGGPKGVGLLVVAPGVPLHPILHGGGQEAGRRPGTANVPGVAGMVAAMAAVAKDRRRFTELVGSERDDFETHIRSLIPGAEVTAAQSPRLPHFSHIRLPGVTAETLLIRLDRAGIMAAAGSACQSGAIEPSHVLTAMGMDPDRASQCVRFTFGWDVSIGEGRRAADAVVRVVKGL